MIWTFFIMGVIVSFIGIYHFDNQPRASLKIAAIPILFLGVVMMIAAIYLRGGI